MILLGWVAGRDVRRVIRTGEAGHLSFMNPRCASVGWDRRRSFGAVVFPSGGTRDSSGEPRSGKPLYAPAVDPGEDQRQDHRSAHASGADG